MKAADIINHLFRYLPEQTDLFSKYLVPTAVTVTGSTVTCTFSESHGVIDDGVISVIGARIENLVSNIDDSGDTVIFTTANSHDITLGFNNVVNLTSVVDPSIDGDYTILSSDNRKTFELESFSEPLLTDVKLNELIDSIVVTGTSPNVTNINGLYESVTVISPTELSFELASTFIIAPTIKPESVKVNVAIRVSGDATIERIIQNYDEQVYRGVWAFVVLGDVDINKDRNVQDDPALQQGGGNAWRALLLEKFSVYVFVPCKNSSSKVQLSGRAAKDLISDIRPSLLNVLNGTYFDPGFVNKPSSATATNGDAIYKYFKAYYVHEFKFEQTAQITNDDIVRKSPTVALRDVNIDYMNVFDDSGEVLMESRINTDEDPI